VTNADLQPLINLLAGAAPAPQSNSSTIVPSMSSQDPANNIPNVGDALIPTASEPTTVAIGDFRNAAQSIRAAGNERNRAVFSGTFSAKRKGESMMIDHLVVKQLPSIDRHILRFALNRSRSHGHVFSAFIASEFDQFFAAHQTIWKSRFFGDPNA